MRATRRGTRRDKAPGMARFMERSPKPRSAARETTYANALRSAIDQEMERDERVFLFGLDVDDHKGIQGTTLGLQEKYGKQRVFCTPLSEDAMTGVAIGAAMAGLRPIHVHIRMDFMLLAMNQLVNMAAKAHYMYNATVKVPLVVRTMIGRSWGQGGQHSQALHALFMHIPGLKVVAPTSPYDAKGLLIAAIRDDNPVIFIEHRLLYAKTGHVPDDAFVLPFGHARRLSIGNDITIVAVSHMVVEACRAARQLALVGVKPEVIDLISLAPLDMSTIMNSCLKTGYLLIVDNAWLPCGASSEIMAQVIEYCQTHQKPLPMIERLGFAHTTCPTSKPLEDVFYPSNHSIARQAYRMLKHKDMVVEQFISDSEIDAFKGPF